jgi:hypothetical protein
MAVWLRVMIENFSLAIKFTRIVGYLNSKNLIFFHLYHRKYKEPHSKKLNICDIMAINPLFELLFSTTICLACKY